MAKKRQASPAPHPQTKKTCGTIERVNTATTSTFEQQLATITTHFEGIEAAETLTIREGASMAAFSARELFARVKAELTLPQSKPRGADCDKASARTYRYVLSERTRSGQFARDHGQCARKKSKSIKLGAHTAASVGIRSDDRTHLCVLPRSHHQPRPGLARPMETSIVCCPNGLQTFSRRRNGFHEAKSDPSKRLLATDAVAVGDRDHCLPRNGRLRRWQTAWCTNFGAETHRCEF